MFDAFFPLKASRSVNFQDAYTLPLRSRHLPAVLVALLLWTSVALVSHHYDQAQHPASEICATCVAAHALGHGIGTDSLAVLLTALSPAFTLAVVSRVQQAPAPPYRARAPPFSRR